MKDKLLFALCTLMLAFSSMSAWESYEYLDVGTLQTKESGAIAINGHGMILGWYNVDGAANGKQYFVRSEDATFNLLPSKDESGATLTWKFLTEDDRAYAVQSNHVYMWEKGNGFTKLATLPSQDIVTIKEGGKILIRYTVESIGGHSYKVPTIWQYNLMTKLRGLTGDLGIESEESYGFDMNNAGVVVGTSLTTLVQKNEMFKKTYAAKWENKKSFDLHKYLNQKLLTSTAKLINDAGDIYFSEGYLLSPNGTLREMTKGMTASSGPFFYNDQTVLTFNTPLASTAQITTEILRDPKSVWVKALRIVSVNNKGQILLEGETLQGEKHILLASFKKK